MTTMQALRRIGERYAIIRGKLPDMRRQVEQAAVTR